ncbi:ThuA domain-containing protein [candidate division KSB1 bacterium]|nr:ThuA domain-containing protein [candidate division KSB1 bacterium]
MAKAIRVTLWNEGRHEKLHDAVKKLYPDGMHKTIATYIEKQGGFKIRLAELDQPQHGLTDKVLADTDVMTWWGHMAHGDVKDEIVDKVHQRVLEGMGLIVLHSGHFSKIFKKLMGTSCDLKWREIGEKERLWVIEPGHPIVDGIGEYIELPHTEMYGERFDIPAPDTLVFVSWFQGGEVFRSGCCYHRGRGKIFYFRPGHETLPIYYNEQVLRVIANAIRWAAPGDGPVPSFGNKKPLEKVETKE